MTQPTLFDDLAAVPPEVPQQARPAVPVAAAEPQGAFASIDLHFADMLRRRGGVEDDDFVVAAALCAKALRLEHVCVVLEDDAIARLWTDDDGEAVADPPTAEALRRALDAATGLVEVVDEGAPASADATAPLVRSGPRCYLRRYAVLEQLVADRLGAHPATGAPLGLDEALRALPGDADPSQTDAVRLALSSVVSVIAGGPGTGKTTTVASLLCAARALDPPLTVALCAPTGKAAARLDEAVRSSAAATHLEDLPAATTIHRLLSLGRDGIAWRRSALEADVVVVDEASMVSLPLLAEVLDRARPDARVVLVGDPDQLASIEVGAVLADVVEAAAARDGAVAVATLSTAHRFEDASGVATLAAAVRAGAADGVAEAVRASGGELEMGEPDELRAVVLERVVDHAAEVVAAARAGDVARAVSLVGSLGVLCATKRGDGSTQWWGSQVERALELRGVLRRRDVDYVGRPLLVTRNDPITSLMNGAIGVVVEVDGERRAAFEAGLFPVGSLASTETVWALTIHKSQGSEYDEVVVSLPRPTSRVLSRELLYTAVTRARRRVTLLAPPGSLDAALSRRVSRASGLAARLRYAQRP